jgi:Cys-tRNA(Pro)/Cys-tRNA(Cys) deacylase
VVSSTRGGWGGGQNRGMATAGTPAILALRAAGVVFTVHEFAHDPAERNYGLAAATALGVEPDRVFKTLLVSATRGASGEAELVVGIVPVSCQLSLRGLATSVGAKRAEMCLPAVAERITGYVVGGISPFGQKQRLRTVIDETCELWPTVFVSGGRRGVDIELDPLALIAVLDALPAPIAT